MKIDYPGRKELFPYIGSAREDLEAEVKAMSTLELAKFRCQEQEWSWKCIIIDAELQKR